MKIKMKVSSNMSFVHNKPKNNMKKWTYNEEKQLLSEVKEEISIEEISEIHSRTIGAITSRLKKIAQREYNKGKNIYEVLSLTNLTEDDIDITVKNIHCDKIKSIEEKMNQIMILMSEINLELKQLKN
jgi:Glu-tRNA(Gln) amidotransferase subunit E-like FAD-binding protein